MPQFVEVVALTIGVLALQVREKLFAGIRPGFAAELLTHKALERTDGDGLVNAAPPAGSLAGGAANAATDGGQRIRTASDQIGVFILARRDGANVSTRIGVNRTGILAFDLLSPILPVGHSDLVMLLVQRSRLIRI
jgi:hypothetical protein